MKSGVILFGHGARNPEYVEPFERIRTAMWTLAPEANIEIGFLELSRPTFEEAFDALVAQGVDHVRVVPIFFAPGRHVLKDLPERAAAKAESHPRLTIELAEAIGCVDTVIAAMARYAIGR